MTTRDCDKNFVFSKDERETTSTDDTLSLFSLFFLFPIVYQLSLYLSLYLAPNVSPASITAFNTSSTSLRVTWGKIPAEQVVGKIKGYTVVFFAVKDGSSSSTNVTLENGNVNETNLVNLRKFTKYSIQVLGFTERDKMGPLSSPIFAMTDQDGKSKCFLQFKFSLQELNPAGM